MKTLKKNNSFPPDVRLRFKLQYDAVRLNGLSIYGSLFRLTCLKQEVEPTQLGIVVSKRVGPAVTRNAVKRRLREIYRCSRLHLHQDLWLVLIAAPKAATASFQELEKEWLRLGKKLSIFTC